MAEVQLQARTPSILPVVEAERCNGCGQWGDRCPLAGDSAIIVAPHGELRLLRGSYLEDCRSHGLVFEAKDQGRDQFRLDDAQLPFQVLDHPPSKH